MKFSVWTNPSHPMDETLDLARFADTHDWHCMWYADHYMPNTGSTEAPAGAVHECWSVVPALAAVTERIRLGTLVAPTTFHHPSLLANRAATIDNLSSGRFVLGLGAGWQINEHAAYGVELPEPKPRVDRFAEAIEIIRSLLTEERTTFDGQYFQFADAPCDPKPVQSPLPILVGSAGPRMLRLLCRFADEWNAWGNPTLVGQGVEKLEAACASTGRDPASIRRTCQAMVFLSEDDALINNIRESEMNERSIVGPASHLVEEIGKYADLGIDEFIVPDFTFGGGLDERLDQYRLFDAEVASHFA
ncbi:MAG: LLM class flavin-dependent oxidoreductase [Actinomycetota bacterium]